jgi:putative salt-induced outer membrane protein
VTASFTRAARRSRRSVIPGLAIRALAFACGASGIASAARGQAAAASTTKLTADLGFVTTSGNTNITTLTANQKLGFARLGWGLEQSFGVIYGTSDDTVNTSTWRAALRGERLLRGRLNAVLGAGWDRNRFSGIQRRFEEYIGLRVNPIQRPADTLNVQIAASLTQQQNTDGTSDTFPAARLSMAYRHAFTGKAYGLESVEVIPTLESGNHYRINNEASLVAPLSSNIAIKLSYVVRFDNQPPATFQKTDTFLTTGIQVTF